MTKGVESGNRKKNMRVVNWDAKKLNKQLAILIFFYQAEDGIRDGERSRGHGNVYKSQLPNNLTQSVTLQKITRIGLSNMPRTPRKNGYARSK